MKFTLIIMPFLLFAIWTNLQNKEKDVNRSLSSDNHQNDLFPFPFNGTDYENIPKGQSLFDELIASWGHIPVGFEQLREKLELTFSYDSIPVLFASSRSLQSKSTSLKKPRIVLSSDFHSSIRDVPLPNKDLGHYLEHRLFFGYSEKADSLEIISFNDEDSRFEFQVIHHFSDKNKQKLLYAERAQCISCHFGSGPIFPTTTWQETNSARQVASKMINVIGSDHYLNIPIYKKKQRPKLAFLTDRSVKHAYYDWITSATIWNKVCESKDCREQAILHAIASFCQKDFKNNWDQFIEPYIKKQSPFNVEYGDPRLIDRSIDSPIKGATDPRNRTFTKMSGITIINDWPKLVGKHFKRLTGTKVCSLSEREVLNRLHEVSHFKSYDPENIAWAVALGKKIDKKFNYPEKKEAGFIPPEFSSLIPHKNTIENFRFFCGRCHSHPDELGFLNGSNTEVNHKMTNLSDSLQERLQWFKEDIADQMPPEGSKEGKMLRENVEFYNGLVNFFNK